MANVKVTPPSVIKVQVGNATNPHVSAISYSGAAGASVTDRLISNGNFLILQADGTVTLPYGATIKDSVLNTLSIGSGSGISQQDGAIAIGSSAGITQTYDAIAIGSVAGGGVQGQESIAIGLSAGGINQSQYSVAIGSGAGQEFQGKSSVAIGSFAGRINQANNTIILNAEGIDLNGVTGVDNAFYVSPVRNDSVNTSNIVFYNSVTKEITYSAVSISGIDQPARNVANSASSNTFYIRGIDDTQNTWIGSNSLYSQAAFALANLISGGLNTANANTIFLSGALATTNANTIFLSGALATTNANTVFLSGALATTNANTIFLSGALATTNANSNLLFSYVNSANANIAFLYGIETSQNANVSLLQGGLNTANANIVFLSGVNTSQNSNISVLFTNTSPNLYLTTVGSSVNSIALGGAPVQNAQVWGTYTIVQVLDTLLFPTTGPTYTIPTITLSANNSGTFEIGQPINQALTVTGTKNDSGAFTQLRINRNTINLTTNTSPTTTTTTNIASQFGFSDPNNQNYTYANTYVDANTIVSGATTWTGYGNYSAGLAKLNNKGVTDSNAFAVLTTTAPQAANATNFATASATITGIYPYFWGVSSTQPTAASIATTIAAGTANKVLAVGSGTLTITYNASSQYIWIAVQTGYASKTTWYNTALNNGSIGAGQFILSPVSQAVNSPNSYWSGVNYNVYISGYATTTSGTIQFS